jgi:hypothetical protein
MDGQNLANKLAIVIQESIATSSFLDSKTTYDYLYEAALEFAKRTQCLTGSQTITTVASQSAYDLNPDFLALYIINSFNELVVKYNDGSSDYWPVFRPYESVYYSNDTTATSIPNYFSLKDKQTLTGRITSAATSNGTSTYGECTLTDSLAPFTNVSVGDTVHNVTDGSDGVVIVKTSTSALITCLFNGTNNDWTTSDVGIIVPQGRMQMILNPPPSTSGHTVTVEYIQKPDPVYSLYRTYRFDQSYEDALVKYAAWIYKYRDRDPNFGDAFYKLWEEKLRKASSDTKRQLSRNNMRVNFNKRSYSNRSYR